MCGGGAFPHLLAIILAWLIRECLAACALYAELIYPSGAAWTLRWLRRGALPIDRSESCLGARNLRTAANA
jgi:hypothetical protein